MTHIDDVVAKHDGKAPIIGWFTQSERKTNRDMPARVSPAETEPRATDKGYFIIDNGGLQRYSVDLEGTIDPRIFDYLTGAFSNFPKHHVLELLESEGKRADAMILYRPLKKIEYQKLARQIPCEI